MATNTYVALATQTLGTAVNSVTFSSIAATYTDLVIVMQAKCATADANISIQFNADTASNYSYTMLDGNGTSTFSSRGSNQTSGAVDNYGQIQQNFSSNDIINILNYSNTTTYKTYTSRANNAGMGVDAIVGLWRSTSAINSVKLICSGSRNFDVGSTFSLYGIASSAVGAKATGGIVSSDANYYYHTFLASGTFTPTSSISADVLIVAGGGSGGNDIRRGGGGGAGGLLYYSAQSLTATGYTCTVGAGGTAGIYNSSASTNGVNSSFGALTAAVGGGKGGGDSNIGASKNGGTGGSGGGGVWTFPSGPAGTGGSGTSGQGNAGGASATSDGEGGGGGAGAAGTAGTNTRIGGAGGIGSSTYSSWGSVTGIGELVSGTYYLAGGGGGGAGDTGAVVGAGGYGGGTAGGNAANPTAGLANTGGGSGGAGGPSVAANGGSGVIIVRYAK